MSQDNIINPHLPTNLAPRRQPPKHLQRSSTSSSSDTSEDSKTTFTNNTHTTTPEPIPESAFVLRTLFHNPTIYLTNKFINFIPCLLPGQNPYIFLCTPFHHITHIYRNKHTWFCKDYSCKVHC